MRWYLAGEWLRNLPRKAMDLLLTWTQVLNPVHYNNIDKIFIHFDFWFIFYQEKIMPNKTTPDFLFSIKLRVSSLFIATRPFFYPVNICNLYSTQFFPFVWKSWKLFYLWKNNSREKTGLFIFYLFFITGIGSKIRRYSTGENSRESQFCHNIDPTLCNPDFVWWIPIWLFKKIQYPILAGLCRKWCLG